MNTIGDHIRKVRLDRCLRQKDVAAKLGADPFTVLNWETGATNPKFRYLPAIIRFLGYDPCPVDPNLPLLVRLKARRQQLGLSQERLARLFGADESSVRKWEAGKTKPSLQYLKKIELFLEPELSLKRGNCK